VIQPDDPRLTKYVGRALAQLVWPNNLPAPVDALDNFLLAKEQSAQTKDGVVPDFQDLARRVCAAREIA
jgi:hypothetical protein